MNYLFIDYVLIFCGKTLKGHDLISLYFHYSLIYYDFIRLIKDLFQENNIKNIIRDTIVREYVMEKNGKSTVYNTSQLAFKNTKYFFM